MSARRWTVVIAGAALAVAGFLALLFWPRPPILEKVLPSERGDAVSSASQTPAPEASIKPLAVPTKEEIENAQREKLTSLYSTPIAVYGKVIDDDGNPVPSATVEIGIADSPMQTGSKYEMLSGADGRFSLAGVRGIAFSASAVKEGYYSTESSTAHRHVLVPGKGDAPQPTAERPLVLVLRKQGEPVKLHHARSRQIDLPASGQSLGIDLSTGQTGKRDLEITSWLGNVETRPFDWRYQLTVPSGGLIERTDRFEFEAPPDGYAPMVEIEMTTTSDQWAARAEREYFAKLPDGRYARFVMRFYPGQRNFVVIESYVNPTPGSRNLEFDTETAAQGR